MNNGIERLMNTLSTATTKAENARNRNRETPSMRTAESKGYNEGQAAAFNEAYYLMKAELERLQNRFQNGSLSREDFDTY